MQIKADCICPTVSLDVKRVNFEANLIALELMDIDVILRMGWLSACKGVCPMFGASNNTVRRKNWVWGYSTCTWGIWEWPIRRCILRGCISLKGFIIQSSILCSVDKLLDHLWGISAFVNMTLQLSYPQHGVQSSTYLGQVGVDDKGRRYLITTDGSMESQEIPMIY